MDQQAAIKVMCELVVLKPGVASLEAERIELEAAQQAAKALTAESTLGDALTIQAKFKSARARYLAKNKRIQSKLRAKASALYDRISERGLTQELLDAIETGSEIRIIRAMLAQQILDMPKLPRRAFELKFGAKTCPHCGKEIPEGSQAIFNEKRDICHVVCFAARVLRHQLVTGKKQ